MAVISLNWALVAMSLVAFTAVNGTVLNKCYSCNSNGACDDVVDTSRVDICHFHDFIDSKELSDTNRVCVKIVYSENGTIGTLRSCALKSSKYYSTDGKEAMDICKMDFTDRYPTRTLTSCQTCESELCNSSSTIGASIVIAIFFFSLFLI